MSDLFLLISCDIWSRYWKQRCGKWMELTQVTSHQSEFAFGSAGCGRKPRNCQQRDTIRTLSQRFCWGMVPWYHWEFYRSLDGPFSSLLRDGSHIPKATWMTHDMSYRPLVFLRLASQTRLECGFLFLCILYIYFSWTWKRRFYDS